MDRCSRKYQAHSPGYIRETELLEHDEAMENYASGSWRVRYPNRISHADRIDYLSVDDFGHILAYYYEFFLSGYLEAISHGSFTI